MTCSHLPIFCSSPLCWVIKLWQSCFSGFGYPNAYLDSKQWCPVFGLWLVGCSSAFLLAAKTVSFFFIFMNTQSIFQSSKLEITPFLHTTNLLLLPLFKIKWIICLSSSVGDYWVHIRKKILTVLSAFENFNRTRWKDVYGTRRKLAYVSMKKAYEFKTDMKNSHVHADCWNKECKGRLPIHRYLHVSDEI
jgi:hypothetical protein